jgi:hypothetical protein
MTCRHKKIRDKVVAITGGARGIGKASGLDPRGRENYHRRIGAS